ncbi:unnamed protein product [Schistosoma turkestanicum]|nr:unnamed protein product [Schistosoma turkestanicum]
MVESLAQAGLYIDDFYKLRIVEPTVSQETNELREECEKYISEMTDFKVIIGELLNLISYISEKVESQKLKVCFNKEQEHIYSGNRFKKPAYIYGETKKITAKVLRITDIDQKERYR